MGEVGKRSQEDGKPMMLHGIFPSPRSDRLEIDGLFLPHHEQGFSMWLFFRVNGGRGLSPNV